MEKFVFSKKKNYEELGAFFTTAKPLIYASFYSQKINFILFFKCYYLISIQHQKHALKTFLEKLLKISDFTLLNKPLRPY